MLNNSNKKPETAEEAAPLSPDELGLDAIPLCPKCLKPVDPQDYYCPHCDSNEPINPLAAYMPFVRIRYMYSVFGTMWRKMWNGETGLFASILFILLIINYAQTLLIIGTPVASYKLLKNAKLQNPRSISLLIIISGIVVLILLSWVTVILICLGF